MAALVAFIGCDDVPTTTVSKCYPSAGDCQEFLGSDARAEADLALGSQLYQAHCTGCHGADGGGPGFGDRGNFADPGWQRRWSDSELMDIVTAGRGTKMPGLRLPQKALESVVAHVRSFDAQRGSADAPIE